VAVSAPRTAPLRPTTDDVLAFQPDATFTDGRE
jgi:hypothetical protein